MVPQLYWLESLCAVTVIDVDSAARCSVAARTRLEPSMNRFPPNDIIHLVGEAPRYDLAESLGPNLQLSDLLDEPAWRELATLSLGYGTAEGDAALRAQIAQAHGVGPDDVVVTA